MAKIAAVKAFERANAKMGEGSYEEAIVLYDLAISESSDYVLAYFNRGQALKKLNKTDEAVISFDQAIAFRPEKVQLYEIFGALLFDIERYDAAANILQRGLEIDSASSKTLSLLSRTYMRLELHEKTIEIAKLALSLNERDFEHVTNYGGALFSLHRYEESVELLKKAAEIRPGYYKSHFNLGIALSMAGSPELAIVEFDKAIAIDPSNKKARLNKAVCQLKMADFANGLPAYEIRNDLDIRTIYDDCATLANLEDVYGKRILIYAEFGLGDTIQFCRYIPLLEARGAKVLFSPQVKLRKLMSSISERVEIVDAEDSSLQFDYRCRTMSLPGVFGTTLESIPAATPYLAVDPERIARWRRIIGERGFKVGVCWRGSRTGDDKGLSFALSDLAGLAAIPGVRLLSLQKSADPSEQKALSEQTVIEAQLNPADLSEEGMLDTAALIAACDLVISCDTSVAHLAGALGRPTWVVMPVDGDWRWLDRRADSPWYPTMRLFRPTLLGSRQAVFEAVEAELSHLVRGL